MPLVSVIIPTYNNGQFIKEAIDSALSQTYSETEIIVIDDGSTDNTRKIVEKYKDRVKYLYKENSGSASARNMGIRESSGKFIAFLDSDDVWEDKKLEEQVRALQNNQEAALIYCGKLWVGEDGNPIKHEFTQHEFPEGWIFEKLFEANYISSASCVVARKDAILLVGGFNESPVFRNAQDYELWLRITARYRCLSISKALVLYRRHAGNVTKRTEASIRGHLAALNSAVNLFLDKEVDVRNYSGQVNVRDRMKRAYEQAVISLFYAGEYKAVKSLGWEALSRNYYSVGLLLKWCISLLPRELINKGKKLRKLIKYSRV